MKIEITQNTPEWEALRRKSIGASDWPIILGISPYKTAWQLWGEKLGIRRTEYTQAMQYGHSIEDDVRRRVSDEIGETFEPCVFQHDELTWLLASLDGFCEVLNIGLEIKSTNKETFEALQEGVVPDHWYAQIQAQMFCSKVERVILFAQYKDLSYSTTIQFDVAFIKDNLGVITEFYKSLIGGEPPEMSDRDYVPVDSEEFSDLEDEYVETKKAYDEMDKKLKGLKKRIEEFGDDGNFEGNRIRVTRVLREGNVDWQALANSMSIPKETIESFRKEQIGYYKISFKNDG